VSIPVIGPALELAVKLMKGPKACVLWYQGADMKWREKTDKKGISKRQCRKEKASLVKAGYDKDRFEIYRVGTDPNKKPGE